MTEWQPIETAPKDGRDILGFAPKSGCVVVEWGGDRWRNYDYQPIDPTHWQPLPQPPVQQTATSSPG